MIRHLASVLGAFCLSWCAAGLAAAALGPSPGGTVGVRLETLTTWTPSYPTWNPTSPPSNQSGDFEIAPTAMLPLNDGTGRRLLATLGGTIRVLDGNFNLMPEPLLTTTQVGLWLPQEAGMTGAKLHPDFANPGTFGYGKLYTIVTEPMGAGTFDYGEPGTSGNRHQDVVREWDLSTLVGDPSVNSLPDVTVADSREVLRVAQRGPFHNIADIAFNSFAKPGDPDYGELYVTSGDGSPNNLIQRRFDAQIPGNIYGTLLRINPDPAAHSLVHVSANTALATYSISPDNHFNDGDDATLPEVVAYGLRSPYRINFDRQTGLAYIGDVGDSAREEVSVFAGGGENFGWGRWEGNFLLDSNVELYPSSTHTEPLFEYVNREPGVPVSERVGGTVVGGFVYRGSEIPQLQGKYVFADFGNGDTNPSKLFYGIVDPDDPDYGTFYELLLDPGGDLFPVGLPPNQTMVPLPNFLFSLAEDEDGELYLLAGQDPRRSNVNDAFVIRLSQPQSLLIDPLAGDVNLDGVVNERDIEAFVAGWLTSGHATQFDQWTHGDMNFDGITNLRDAWILHQALKTAQGTGFPFVLLGVPAVPEPTSLSLAAVALLGVALRRSRRRTTPSDDESPGLNKAGRGHMIARTKKQTMFGKLRRPASLLVAMLASPLTAGNSASADFAVTSPNGNITATLTYDEQQGTVSYRVESDGREIISSSPIGIHTSRGDFRSGLALTGDSREVVDETYALPQGKVSTYHNHANELVLRFRKEGAEVYVRFRVYDDGIAFSFAIPGSGDVDIFEESSAIHLSGENFTCWGQEHPNSYGYETMLGPVTGRRLSIPVLAHLKDRDHFVLMAQAATYGHYIQPHFERRGASFRFRFPLDQEQFGPVRTTLPFQSPWRMIIVSPENLAGIVESSLVENLSPPSDPSLMNQDGTLKSWLKPGRVMWDFIAGDRDKPRMWIDATAEMGWEYYLADAGFANRWGGREAVREATDYAAARNVSVIGWAHTREFETPEKAAANMRRLRRWGLKGAKIDFFDHNTRHPEPRSFRDYEDTQPSLQMRDGIFELGIENQMLLEFHGSTMPTGERRRYPHLMTLEAVAGMEKRTPTIENDLTIPFVRNVMGPVSYTIIRFNKSPGSHAYQLATSIVYEAGMMIYAEHGRALLDWPGREMIQDVPADWDETRFVDGMPGSHVIIARRKVDDWYLGGMTADERTAEMSLDFLTPGVEYDALLFRDESHATMQRQTHVVDHTTSLSIPMLENGGFAVRFRPRDAVSGE